MNYFIYNNKNKNLFLKKINCETPPTNFGSTTVLYPLTLIGYTRCFNTETNTWGDAIRDYRGIKIYYKYNSINSYICNDIDLPEGYTTIIPPNEIISYELNIAKNLWLIIGTSGSFASTPNNVTKFLVYANEEAIPAGSSIALLSTTYTTSVLIPSGMTHQFKLDLFGSIALSDVIIDWGDGNVTKVNETTSTTFSHRYSTTGKYLITISGLKYNRIRSVTTETNLICRIFLHDLPTTAKIKKASSLCAGALRLIELDCTYNDTFTKLINFPYLFLNCQNLKKAIGFPNLTYVESVEGIFSSCYNLITTDFRLPEYSGNYTSIFAACYELTTAIDKLLPIAGFVPNIINLSNTFTGLAKSSISNLNDLNNKLFQNKSLTFTGTLTSYFGTTYTGPNGATVQTNSNILSNIAVEYGGTNSDIAVLQKDSVNSAHNIFDIFYSLSKTTPPGAMDLSLGTLISNCNKVFPDFWSECLLRRGNAHMFPQFSGSIIYLWPSNGNVLGDDPVDGNAVCYYNGKIYILATNWFDGDDPSPALSSLWRLFVVPTESWDALKQYSIGDTVLYNGLIWCARTTSDLNSGAAPGTTDAEGMHYWALYDLPTLIIEPSIRTLTESLWQAEVAANGSCGAFVVDETAKSVRLPKITHIIQPGDIGVFTKAGLPNIEGSFQARVFGYGSSYYYNILNASGVLSTGLSTEKAATTTGSSVIQAEYNNVTFSASRASSIYGNSTTVQPPTVGAKLYIQVYTSVVPASVAQASEFINMLETKADKTELETKADKTDLSDYLPLAGGTMTGITRMPEQAIRAVTDTGVLRMYGGAGNDSAGIFLFGKNRTDVYAGRVYLNAQSGTTFKYLVLGPDGTFTWDGVPVLNPTGTVIAFAGNSAPAGYIICNGAAVSRTTYANLFAVIGTTYGAGNGSSTFNLPNLTNRFIMGSGTAGTVKSAGLPNITGSFEPLSHNNDYPTLGAFYYKTAGNGQSDANSKGAVFGFDASRSSSIYGASTTVQPPALTMRYYIKY